MFDSTGKYLSTVMIKFEDLDKEIKMRIRE